MFGLEAMVYSPTSSPKLPCGHPPFTQLIARDQVEAKFCGLCWLQDAWEAELPRRFHEYKLLAENGNPETSPRFWAHLEANLGLIPPKPDENLRSYRLARERLYGKPSKRQFPVAAALYEIMGYQPKLARPVVLSLCGSELVQIQKSMAITTFGLATSMSKGIRITIKKVQEFDDLRESTPGSGSDSYSAEEANYS